MKRDKGAGGPGALHSRALIPSALGEELVGWVILFKDLLQKTALAHDEARLILGSLSFLKVYSRRSPGPRGERSTLRQPFAPLAHIVAELRQLREEVRDDLVLVQMFFLHERRYEDFFTPEAEDDVRSAAITGATKSRDTLRQRYMAALHVLWTTQRLAAHLVMGVLRRMDSWPKDSLIYQTLQAILAEYRRREAKSGGSGDREARRSSIPTNRSRWSSCSRCSRSSLTASPIASSSGRPPTRRSSSTRSASGST